MARDKAKKVDYDKRFIMVSMVINLFVIVGIVLFNIYDIHLNRFTYPCTFRTVTGVCCPGCGLTRSIDSLIHFHPIRSFIFHPMVLYALGLYLYASIGCIFLRPGFLVRNDKKLIRLLIIGVVILFVQWIIKIIFPII